MGAFATGVPPDINAFHRYTGNSPILFCTQAPQYETHFPGWARGFHIPLTEPPARPLRPVIPNNVCSPRITAAAGTELAGASFCGTVEILRLFAAESFSPHDRGLQPEGLHPPRGVARSGFP